MDGGDPRIKAIEERLSEVETAQRVDMKSLAVRIQALEMNFSLLNATVTALDAKVDALDAKVTVIDTKLDQILALLRSPDGARPH